MSTNQTRSENGSSTGKVAVIHSPYAIDDVMADQGWDGIEVHMAIDWHSDPEGEVLFVSRSLVDVQTWCIDNHYSWIGCTTAFTHDGKRWVRS